MPRLTELQLKNEQPGDRARKNYDERGLFLLVNPDGSMYWRVRYSLDGKEKLTQVGVYRKKGTERVTMRLSEARERRDELRDMLSRGLDPSAHRQAESARLKLEAEQARSATREVRAARLAESQAKKIAAGDAKRTVSVVVEEWIEAYRPGWSVQHAHQNWQSLRDHVLPVIGAKPIRTVGTADILTVLQRLLAEGKAETARRVRQRLAAVFSSLPCASTSIEISFHWLQRSSPSSASRLSSSIPLSHSLASAARNCRLCCKSWGRIPASWFASR